MFPEITTKKNAMKSKDLPHNNLSSMLSRIISGSQTEEKMEHRQSKKDMHDQKRRAISQAN